MATTVTSSTLRVWIKESIKLNGEQHGGETILSIPSINEISKRIVTVTTTEAEIATFSAVIGPGRYIAADVRYIRFTNLDNTNFITLTFRNQDSDEVAIKLDAGHSFMWCGDNDNGMTAVFNAEKDADAASDTAFGSLTNIQADANEDSCDLEMFIASA